MKKPIHVGCALIVLLPMLAIAQQAVPPAPPAPPLASPASPAPVANTSPASTPAPGSADGRIHLNIVVTDKPGKPVSGLALTDFALKDNNLPVKILSFQAIDAAAPKNGPPAEVILLLDAVNLGVQEVARTRGEMAKFLRQNGGHLGQPVPVFLFTDQGVKVLLQPSSDGNALAAKLDQTEPGIRTLSRSAGANGAIERFELSMQWMAQIANAEKKRSGRKLLIWGGPGWPLLDSPRFQPTSSGGQKMFNGIVSLSTLLREAQMTLYSVSLGDPGLGTYLYEGFLKGVKTADKANASDLGLKVLAIQTGGRAMPPDNDLAGQVSRCVEDAATYYIISFDPAPADKPNEYHDLKVEVDKPGLTARTTTGYYNHP